MMHHPAQRSRPGARVRRPAPRRGFTMLEMLITVTVMAVVAVSVIPALTDNRGVTLAGAAAILQSDIELVQSLRIAFPAQERVLVLDPDSGSWWLALADDPDTPVAIEPGGPPYITVLGQDRARMAGNVALNVPDPVDQVLAFNAFGGLDVGRESPSILLTADDMGIFVSVSRTTGVIRTLAAEESGSGAAAGGQASGIGGSGSIVETKSSTTSSLSLGTGGSVWTVFGDAPSGSLDGLKDDPAGGSTPDGDGKAVR